MNMHNKALHSNLQAVRFAVSLSLHFTAKRTAYKLRLKRALELEECMDKHTKWISSVVFISSFLVGCTPEREGRIQCMV